MEKKLFDRFNIFILLAAFGLVSIGLIAIYSATFGNAQTAANFTKQLMAGIAGLVIVLVLTFLPPKYLSRGAFLYYAFVVLLLAAVLFFGKRIKGHISWFSFGGLSFQPSEFAKTAVVLSLAAFLSNRQKDTDVTRPKDFIMALGIGLFPVALILLQHDIGTSLVFVAVLIPILYWGGMPNFTLFVILAPAVTAICAFIGTWLFVLSLFAVLVLLLLFKKNLLISTLIFSSTIVTGLSVNFVFNNLQPYVQKRILAMFNPEADALGSGYNVIQSKIAIGSGGMWGKGFLQGTQTQLKYIPEQWTDFIFCMVGEEFGFVGSLTVVILYFILIWQTIYIAYNCKNKFLSTCCIGFSVIITFHVLVNMGMTMGIMPVIGIPLPFMSYGVSFLLSSMIMLGIIMNAYRNRKEYV